MNHARVALESELAQLQRRLERNRLDLDEYKSMFKRKEDDEDFLLSAIAQVTDALNDGVIRDS